MATQQSVVHEICKKGYRYNGICFDGENYWLSPRTTAPIVKWNPQTGETREFADFYHPTENTVNPFQPIVYCHGFVWLLPCYNTKHAFMIDVHSDSATIAEAFEIEAQADPAQPIINYSLAYVAENSIWAYNRHKGTLLEYNCETKKRREEAIQYPMIKINSLLADNFIVAPEAIKVLSDCHYYECELLSLRAFINYLVLHGDSAASAAMAKRRAEILQARNLRMDGTAGQAIYEFAKKQP
jgi:hypothetical protein